MVYIEKGKDRINRKRKGTRINIKSRAGEITSSDSRTKTKDMKKKKIKVFNIAIICLICLLMIFGLIKLISNNSKTGDDNLIYNKNKSFIKHQKIKGIAFKDINCTYDGKNSLITYTIINETNKDIYLSNYDVIIRDKNKQIITKIVASYSENVPPKKKISMANSVIGMNLTNAYYMELKLKTGKK